MSLTVPRHGWRVSSWQTSAGPRGSGLSHHLAARASALVRQSEIVIWTDRTGVANEAAAR